jgi:hypothetical protein
MDLARIDTECGCDERSALAVPQFSRFLQRVGIPIVSLETLSPATSSTSLRYKVRGNDADEFAGRNDLGILPEPGKMLRVARDQVVGPGSIRALHELVVAGIVRNLQDAHGFDQVRAVRQQLEELLPKSFADFEFWPRENFAVLRKNGVSDIQPGWSGHCQHEHGALQSVRFQNR